MPLVKLYLISGLSTHCWSLFDIGGQESQICYLWQPWVKSHFLMPSIYVVHPVYAALHTLFRSFHVFCSSFPFVRSWQSVVFICMSLAKFYLISLWLGISWSLFIDIDGENLLKYTIGNLKTLDTASSASVGSSSLTQCCERGQTSSKCKQ